MTTAHRPTFDPARGKDQLKGPAYHQRLLPAHTHLKQRQKGQGGTADSAVRNLRADLFQAEAAHRAQQGTTPTTTEEGGPSRFVEKRSSSHISQALDQDGIGDVKEAEAKRRRLVLEEARVVDADSDESDPPGGTNSDNEDGDDDDDADEDDDDDEGEDDEELFLQRELAKVKAERAQRKVAEESAQAAIDAKQREAAIAHGNPLMNKTEYGVKRRWDDDVVFKNQARGSDDKTKNKEFVNDLLRSDFHKRFMSKYVR